ncbi:MAG: hypothetical protein IJU56_08750, partial [Clostridia bacterium]|nr:hypothetical protein [Clostridia bacterium]
LISGCKAVFEVQFFSKGKVETRRKPDGFQGVRQSILEKLPSKTNTSLRKEPQAEPSFSIGEGVSTNFSCKFFKSNH